MSELCEALTLVIRQRDVKIFEAKAMLSFNTWCAITEKLFAGSRAKPSRKNAEAWWDELHGKLVSSAERVVRTTNKFGIDLEKADILVKEISFASLYPRAGSGTVEDRLAGNRFKMVLAVTTDGKATTGKGLSGKYVLAAEKAMRFGGRWLISRKVRWRKLPAGVVDANTAADLEFENYVAEQALIQRCRVHKLHNVPEHLPEEKQQQAAWRLRGAWAKATPQEALKKLRALLKWLDAISP